MAPLSMDHSRQGSKPIASLGRTRGVTRWVMAAERLWPLVLPLLLVIGLFLAASWFGLFRIVPEFLRLALAVLFGVAALASLFPLRFFRWPRRYEVDRRIETHNRLQHAPVLTQSDQLTGKEDPFATALWREHQRRMADKLARLSSDLPQTSVPERDPFGGRAAVALLVIIAFAFSVSPYGGRVFDAFQARPGVAPIPPRVDAWVTPPAYTGRAPIFLTADAALAQPVLTVPAGSEVAVRITGGSGDEALQFADGAGTVTEIAPLG
ncbi:MAG TPA: DUF4175 family protein, partial [Tianweitania sediminis]|nr:DUF4175 family protein [Tianweitania sediminis]